VDALRAVVSDMAEVGPEAEPPERLWARIEASVRAIATAAPNGRAESVAEPATQAWTRWRDDAAAAAPLAFVAAAGPWEATAVPGIAARKLFVDEKNDRVTMLVRMSPGAAYPSHRHAGPEECFVLQGDLRTGDVVQHAGEYQRAATGSVHPSQSTEKGCVLLIVSSLHDTLIAA
jgi:anti-sigma factor ChrR (cupin superfamily)